MPFIVCRVNFILGCGCGREAIDLIPHTFQYFIVRAGNGILVIATLAIYTRLLSPAEYGIYALGMSVATLASGILFEWLNAAVGRFYPMHLGDSDKIIDVTALGFWAAAAVALLLFLSALTFHEVFSVEPALFGILFLITVALGRHTLALQVANAQSAPVRYGGLSWAKSGGALLVGFILIHYGDGGRGALLGFLSGLVFAVTVFAPRPWMRMRVGNVDKSLSVELFRYGLPLTLNHVAIAVVDVADRFLIGSLLGVAHVAPYAIAYDLVQQSVGPMMNVLFLAAFPVIVQVFNVVADEPARVRLHALGSRLVAVGLPAAVGLGILSSDISEIIFGNGYRQDAAAIMPWLAAAIFVGAFKSYFLDVVFQMRHSTKYLGYIAILMATVNIVLNLLLLPRYGVIAAAWATLAAFSVGALASWVVGKSIFLLPALGSVFWRSAGASATMAIVLYLLPLSSGIIWLSAKLVLGIVTYGVMAWALDVADCRRLLKV
jgi:O-antigen/teichoic acid export membrane protein